MTSCIASPLPVSFCSGQLLEQKTEEGCFAAHSASNVPPGTNLTGASLNGTSLAVQRYLTNATRSTQQIAFREPSKALSDLCEAFGRAFSSLLVTRKNFTALSRTR